jgi:hypothetical protein
VWVLAVLGVLVLCCGILVGGIVWWAAKNKDRLASEGKKVMVEAEAYAASHNQNDCVEEGLRRVDACSGFVCEGMAKVFTSTCVKKAQKVEGFCDGVPPKSEIIKTSLWIVEECDRRGKTGSQQCNRLMQEVPEACHAEP